MSDTTLISPETLQGRIHDVLGDFADAVFLSGDEITAQIKPASYVAAMERLKTAPGCCFEQLIDLCGIDYFSYGQDAVAGPRFAVVLHLLSVSLNQRLRVRVFCPDDDFPLLPSITCLWHSANWYEREAFDLYGIFFEGHTDLRRILTDYGFIGHPFRKDFPLVGHVEMHYDPERQRVAYRPVSIEAREVTPRIIREDHYAGLSPVVTSNI